MELKTLFTAILVIMVVWGGLIYFLNRAAKYEKLKQKNGEV